MRDVTPRDRLAWRGALLAATLGAIGSPLDLLVGRNVPGLPKWPPLIAGLVCASFGVVLIATRKRPDYRLASALFMANSLVIATFLWLGNSYYAALGNAWAPFQANKLAALTVAVLTPELGVGIASVLLYGGTAVLRWYTFALPVRSQLATGEPVTTVIYSVFGLILLVQSHRRYLLERRMAQAEAETRGLEEKARSFLMVRDFTNTPLQTIDSTAALVALRHPEVGNELAPIRRSIVRLRQLNQYLAQHDSSIRWDKAAESMDASAVLEAPPLSPPR